MIPHRARVLLLVIFAFVVAPLLQTSAADRAPTPVEVWKVGDDGLTNRLRDAIESAFRSASDFRLSNGKQPGTLIATIPTNVDWKKIGQRTKVFYDVKFTSVDAYELGASKGSCWDDSFGTCAARILKDARIAARKISFDKNHD